MSVLQQDSAPAWGQTYGLHRKRSTDRAGILCACTAPYVPHLFFLFLGHSWTWKWYFTWKWWKSDNQLFQLHVLSAVGQCKQLPQTIRFYVRISRTSILSRNKSKIHQINTYKLPISMAPLISPYSSPPLLITDRHLCCTRVPESHQIVSNHTMGHSNDLPSPDLF